MADAQLSTSITSISERASEVAVSASAAELQKISRVAPNLEQSENTALEVAINARAEDIAGTATAADLKKIGKAIGNMLEPQTTSVSGEFIGSQSGHAGKFFSTNGTSKNWGGVTVGGLQQVQLSTIENDQTLVYNSISGKFENSSRAFDIPQYSLTQNIPTSASAGEVVFDVQSSQLKYWDGSEWKVAAVVAAASGESIKSVEFLPPGYIVVADSDDLTLTGAFTIETWLKPAGTVQAASKTYNTIASKWDGGGQEYWFALGIYDGQQNIVFDFADQPGFGGGNDPLLRYPTNDFVDGNWVHVAVVRTTDGTITIYVNGVSVVSVSRSFNADDFTHGQTSEPLYIGSYNAGQYNADWEGLISDFRIVNGDAVYTTNFTPPTQPLQKIANTVLLTARGVTESGDLADESDSNHAVATYYGVSLVDEMPYTISSGSGESSEESSDTL